MNQTSSGRRGRRPLLFAASLIAVGAAAGAAMFAALSGATSSDNAAAAVGGSTRTASDVASTTPQYAASAIYKKDSPGVVDIMVTEAASPQSAEGLSPFVPGGGSQQAQAEGTGFVYDKQGDIVTASHVVSGAT